MNNYAFQVDNEGRQFCDEIVRLMVDVFEIAKDEALGRLNRQWKGMDLNTHADYPGFRYREDPEFWAHRIYYIDQVNKWQRGELLPAKPFP